MPELAEVEFFRRQWSFGLRQTVERVALHPRKRIFRQTDTAALARVLPGSRLVSATAHGKRMLFRFSGDAWLGVHLGMTGELRVERRAFAPGRHDHLALFQPRQTLVFADARLFGRVRFHQGPEPPAWWKDLPPAVNSAAFTRARLQAFLHRHARAPLKALLLSQEGFPGVGNWMADEILWRAQLPPLLQAGQVAEPDTSRLWRAVRFVAAGAVRWIAPSYADPPPTWLFRHRWEPGGKCPRDGLTLRRATVGGRTTVWCERCQG